MLVKLFAALSAVLVAVPATAQDAVPAVPLHTPAPANVAAASGMPVHNAILRAGTSVSMRTLAELTTKGKRLKVGHRFNLEVAEPVMVDGQVVIPAGSPAVGEVTHVRNKGMWGKSGGIEARVVYVRAGDRQIRLSGQMDDKGVTGTAGVVGAVIAVPLAGFFVTGDPARSSPLDRRLRRSQSKMCLCSSPQLSCIIRRPLVVGGKCLEIADNCLVSGRSIPWFSIVARGPLSFVVGTAINRFLRIDTSPTAFGANASRPRSDLRGSTWHPLRGPRLNWRGC